MKIIMKIIIPIQSYSDIITNSSSELFCAVKGNDKEATMNALKAIISGDGESSVDDYYYYYNKETDKEVEDNSYASLHLGYDCDINISYLRKTIVPYLDSVLGVGNYEIKFED